MSVVGLTLVLFVVFFCSGFRLPLSPLLCFITVVLNIMCLKVMFRSRDEDQTYIISIGATSEFSVMFCASKTYSSPSVVFLVILPWQFFCSGLLYLCICGFIPYSI